jgi:hypothetical protein
MTMILNTKHEEIGESFDSIKMKKKNKNRGIREQGYFCLFLFNKD